jgi:hypothetical protein
MSIWYYLVDEEKAKLGKNLNFSFVGENIGVIPDNADDIEMIQQKLRIKFK